MESRKKQKNNGTSQKAEKLKKASGCSIAGKCGSCRYSGVPYDKQLKTKQKMMQELLGGFGRVEPITGMEDPLHYRAKVHYAFDRDRRGNIIAGCYEADSHKVVDLTLTGCLIEDEKCQEIMATVKKLMYSFKIKTYDEDTGYGLLRHCLIRRGVNTGEIMVVLVLSSPIFPGKNNFVKALRSAHPEIKTIVINVNDADTSLVLGEKEIVIYGPGYITDELMELKFRISPKSFYQVNPRQTEKLYQTAIGLAGLTGKETVLDAYCGTGTIGLCAAKSAREVIGVELNPDAVRDARINAKINGIKNAVFHVGDAGEFMEKNAAALKCDVLFMDPPRSGSTEKFLNAAVKAAPNRIIYISCGPESLKRDLNILTKKGYAVKRIQPVDMFPFTEHVETVVLLSKGEIDSKKIRVEFSLEDMDTSGFQQGATYEQIKGRVLEQTELKVSSLYISQIKRKCGLEVGQSYNLSKKENAKQPQCPPEKEKAIREAMKYFGMI